MGAERKLGPVLLSGLIIGPVLGSGIILLPPLVYRIAGDQAIIAWTVTMGLSFLFAYLFGQLTIRYPGDAGMATAVENAFGRPIKHLAAQFLIAAVLVGPVAVMLTAAEYLSVWLAGDRGYSMMIAFFLLGICFTILLWPLAWVSRVSLLLSSLAAGTLVVGSLAAIPYFRSGSLWQTPFHLPDFGYGLLLLFWALVGWEMIGNYSLEVRDLRRTIPRAIAYSAVVVTLVSLAVAAATQWIDPARVPEAGTHSLRLALVLTPLFGRATMTAITLLTTGLCISTYLLAVGSASRLIASLADEGALPQWMSKRSRHRTPVGGLTFLTVIHLTVLTFTALGWLHLERLVSIADAFFLCNALLGIVAAFRLFRQKQMKTVAVLLGSGFVIILAFSSWWVLLMIAAMGGNQLYRSRAERLKQQTMERS
ncbi:amino acid permease [Polycladomyces abyssicola]|uniref:Amino acid permease n=1 Tax=Polycladomyces abyssicola TaxID=1125966 RepID=A0A8D5UEY0_9BACL|nr:APC family permease [Polycladomyces abyssicola]BCU81463.1 amino acid permease [Polycladomyces abyssicola]